MNTSYIAYDAKTNEKLDGVASESLANRCFSGTAFAYFDTMGVPTWRSLEDFEVPDYINDGYDVRQVYVCDSRG